MIQVDTGDRSLEKHLQHGVAMTNITYQDGSAHSDMDRQIPVAGKCKPAIPLILETSSTAENLLAAVGYRNVTKTVSQPDEIAAKKFNARTRGSAR